MALDITALQEWVSLHPELLTKSVRKNTIVQRFSDIRTFTGFNPGKHKYRIFDPVANLNDCCTVPNGTSVVTEREVELICLLDGQEYCEEVLSELIYNADFRFTAGMESAGSVEEVITQAQIDAFLIAIDKLIFQGDTANADPNLNKVDGLLKIARTDGVVQTATTGSFYQAVRNAIAALPAEARLGGKRIGVFVGEEWGDVLQANYINMNLYHYNPGVYEPYAELPLFGLGNVVIIPTPGLTGTNQMLVTPMENIVFWTNRLDDMETLSWRYTEYHQLYYWRIKTIFGIDLKFPEWAVVVTLDPALLTNGVVVDANVTITNDPLVVSNDGTFASA